MDCSLPGSSVHVISQARILGWVAIPFSRGFFQHRDRTWVFCIGRQIPYCWTTREVQSWADFGKNSWSTLTCMNASGQLYSSSPMHVFSEIMGRHCCVLCLERPTCSQWKELFFFWTLTEGLTPWIRCDFCFQTFSVSSKYSFAALITVEVLHYFPHVQR